MFKRLLECKKSIYNKQKLLKEYRQSQSYKKNVCKYPSINFYKTQKFSYYFSTLNSPMNKPLINIKNNFNTKSKITFKKKTSYQNLFFSSHIGEANVDNKLNSKLFLDNLNANFNTQRKVNQYFKTHYAIKNFYDNNRLENSNCNNKQKYIFNRENLKTNTNNINEIKKSLFSRNKNQDQNVILKADSKEN